MVPAGTAIATPGRAPGTARVPSWPPPRQSVYVVQKRLSTGPAGVLAGPAVTGSPAWADGAAAAGPAPPATAVATAAARRALREGCAALLMGG
ncbi:hypothetical protein GCM10020295_69420 [Streptomyces cinereospinus]